MTNHKITILRSLLLLVFLLLFLLLLTKQSSEPTTMAEEGHKHDHQHHHHGPHKMAGAPGDAKAPDADALEVFEAVKAELVKKSGAEGEAKLHSVRKQVVAGVCVCVCVCVGWLRRVRVFDL